jgi:hypothetical protein
VFCLRRAIQRRLRRAPPRSPFAALLAPDPTQRRRRPTRERHPRQAGRAGATERRPGVRGGTHGTADFMSAPARAPAHPARPRRRARPCRPATAERSGALTVCWSLKGRLPKKSVRPAVQTANRDHHMSWRPAILLCGPSPSWPSFPSASTRHVVVTHSSSMGRGRWCLLTRLHRGQGVTAVIAGCGAGGATTPAARRAPVRT